MMEETLKVIYKEIEERALRIGEQIGSYGNLKIFQTKMDFIKAKLSELKLATEADMIHPPTYLEKEEEVSPIKEKTEMSSPQPESSFIDLQTFRDSYPSTRERPLTTRLELTPKGQKDYNPFTPVFIHGPPRKIKLKNLQSVKGRTRLFSPPDIDDVEQLEDKAGVNFETLDLGGEAFRSSDFLSGRIKTTTTNKQTKMFQPREPSLSNQFSLQNIPVERSLTRFNQVRKINNLESSKFNKLLEISKEQEGTTTPQLRSISKIQNSSNWKIKHAKSTSMQFLPSFFQGLSINRDLARVSTAGGRYNQLASLQTSKNNSKMELEKGRNKQQQKFVFRLPNSLTGSKKQKVYSHALGLTSPPNTFNHKKGQYVMQQACIAIAHHSTY